MTQLKDMIRILESKFTSEEAKNAELIRELQKDKIKKETQIHKYELETESL